MNESLLKNGSASWMNPFYTAIFSCVTVTRQHELLESLLCSDDRNNLLRLSAGKKLLARIMLWGIRSFQENQSHFRRTIASVISLMHWVFWLTAGFLPSFSLNMMSRWLVKKCINYCTLWRNQKHLEQRCVTVDDDTRTNESSKFLFRFRNLSKDGEPVGQTLLERERN